MNDKLLKSRPPEESPAPRPAATPLIFAEPREGKLVRLGMIAGPIVGFALAALLAVSFGLALAGGAGNAALGQVHHNRMAVFVL